MPHTYLVDVKKIIDELSKDDESTLEERLVLLSMITEYLAKVSKELEDRLTGETGGQDQ